MRRNSHQGGPARRRARRPDHFSTGLGEPILKPDLACGTAATTEEPIVFASTFITNFRASHGNQGHPISGPQIDCAAICERVADRNRAATTWAGQTMTFRKMADAIDQAKKIVNANRKIAN